MSLVQLSVDTYNALNDQILYLDMVWFGHVYDWLNQWFLWGFTTDETTRQYEQSGKYSNKLIVKWLGPVDILST